MRHGRLKWLQAWIFYLKGGGKWCLLNDKSYDVLYEMATCLQPWTLFYFRLMAGQREMSASPTLRCSCVGR